MAKLSCFAVAILVLIGACAAAATNCTTRAACNQVSDRPDFVSCVDGVCVCATDRGYVGDATAASKCSCPRESVMIRSAFYCIDPQSAVELQQESDNCKRNKAAVARLFNALVWVNDTVNPLPWIYSTLGLPSPVNYLDLVDPNYKISVKPFGHFDNAEDALLYYLLFAVNNIQVPAAWLPQLYCEGNQVHARADIGFGIVGYGVFLNITEISSFTMSAQNKPISADAYAIDIPIVTAPSTADQEAFIAGVCNDLTVNPGFWPYQQKGFCPYELDPVNNFRDYNDCVTVMRARPFGSYQDTSQLSVVCAREHATMSFVRPGNSTVHHHCFHAGRYGDPVHCTLNSYADFYKTMYKKRDVPVQIPVSAGVGPFISNLVSRTPPSA